MNNMDLMILNKITVWKKMVPKEGLEPSRLASVDFESTASAIPPLRQVGKKLETEIPHGCQAPCAKSCESTFSPPFSVGMGLTVQRSLRQVAPPLYMFRS